MRLFPWKERFMSGMSDRKSKTSQGVTVFQKHLETCKSAGSIWLVKTEIFRDDILSLIEFLDRKSASLQILHRTYAKMKTNMKICTIEIKGIYGTFKEYPKDKLLNKPIRQFLSWCSSLSCTIDYTCLSLARVSLPLLQLKIKY